jgi:hypothetical protein
VDRHHADSGCRYIRLFRGHVVHLRRRVMSTGAAATRGGLTMMLSAFSRPAHSNSSTSAVYSAAERCIASARGSVTPFVTNSPVSRMFT